MFHLYDLIQINSFFLIFFPQISNPRYQTQKLKSQQSKLSRGHQLLLHHLDNNATTNPTPATGNYDSITVFGSNLIMNPKLSFSLYY